MAKYLIHACEERMWYVEQDLIPTLLEQGINIDDIEIYNDTEHLGNLEAYVASLRDSIFVQSEEIEGVWHLQDDIVISKQFKRWTEEYDEGLVCGFCNLYSEKFSLGQVKSKDMWYSFQCMRITNDIAKKFVEWFYSSQRENSEFREWVKTKHDDYVFHRYMETHFPGVVVLNLAPNIVDHIDYLLGGSIINYIRGDMNVRSIYWDEYDTIHNLRERLKVIKNE